jgi:hypothetical protein
MCEKCVELDKKLAHYRQLAAWVVDQQALSGIRLIITKYEADKKAAHPGGPEVY